MWPSTKPGRTRAPPTSMTEAELSSGRSAGLISAMMPPAMPICALRPSGRRALARKASGFMVTFPRLHRHRASFETRSASAPQDEGRLMMACPNSPHPEEARSAVSKDARWRSNPPSHKGEQAPWCLDQDGVDLVLAEAALAHHRHDILEDVAVAVAAELGQPRAVADVVRDDDALEMAVLDQRAQPFEAHTVIRHVDVGEAVIGMLLAEEIELDDDAAIGEAQQAVRVEDRAVDMADDGAGRVAAIGGDEVGDLLRLIGIAAGMDVERGAGLLLGDQGAAHDASFERRPGA